MLVHPCSQVLPDFARDAPKGSAASRLPSSHNLSVEADRLAKFMATESEQSELAKTTLVSEPSGYRVPNQYYMQAYEHALSAGVGKSFSDFVPDSVAQPLRPGELRYYVDHAALNSDVELPEDDPPNRRRACIFDPTTQASRVEVPIETEGGKVVPRCAVHTVVDKGSVGFPSLCWLYWRQKVRGCIFADFWHQDWNSVQTACLEVGMWHVCLERAVVLNLPMGPWARDAWFGELKGCASHFFRHNESTNGLFSMLFERICREDLDFDVNFASADHIAKVWHRVADCHWFHSTGAKCRMGRWYSLFTCARERGHHDAKLLLILVYLGCRHKWWASVWDSPLCRSKAPEAQREAQAPAPAAAAAEPTSLEKKQTVKSSNDQVRELRKDCRNTLELVCNILANEKNCRLFRCVQYAIQPMQASFLSWESQVKTKRGSLAFHMDLARGVSDQIVSTMLGRLQDSQEALHLGFDPHRDGGSRSVDEDDLLVAQKLFDVTIALGGQRLLGSSWYSSNLPGLFVLLLSPSDQEVQETLKVLSQIWQLLNDAERLSAADVWLAGTLQTLIWPGLTWVREMLILLSECEFKAVPYEVRSEVLALFTSLLTTLPVEEAMGVLSSRQDSNPGKKCQGKTRWHALLTSGLTSKHDMVPPPVTPAVHAMAGSSLPSTLFSADVQDFSMGMDTLRSISDDKSWPSPSAATWNAGSSFVRAMLALKGEWHLLRNAWLSLLLQPGHVVTAIASPRDVQVVVSVSKWGAVLWPVRCVRQGSQTRIEFVQWSEERRCPWRWQIIHHENLHSFQCCAVKVLPPTTSGGAVVRLLLESQAKRESLAKAAARRAFLGLTAPMLSRLWDHLDLKYKGHKPSSEAGLLAILVDHLLGELSVEQREAIINARVSHTTRKSAVASELASSGAIDLLDGIIDTGDIPMFQQLANKAAGSKASSRSLSSSTPGSSSSSGKRAPLPGAKEVTPDWAKQFCPVGPGITLHWDIKWHNRWIAGYKKRSKPPYTAQKSWGDGSVWSKRAALVFVLKWLWEVHEEETGSPCPWSWGDEMPCS